MSIQFQKTNALAPSSGNAMSNKRISQPSESRTFENASSTNHAKKRRKSRQKKVERKPRIPFSERRIILFNKPYDTLSQFTDGNGRKTLADYITIKDIYAAGRLDRDSEGLLILTNDGVLQAQLTQPNSKSPKTYWVQVDGAPNETDLDKLRQGVELKDGLTLPANIEIINEPTIWDRISPVRFRANIPTTWLKITIIEGRNRQVRRMTAHIGFPTLRLIRYSVGDYSISDLQPGDWKEISPN
jgi:23S rRNA pseudouridine2457 synthase